MGHSYSDRDWFKMAVSTKAISVSDFYISKIVNKLCITVSAPVLDDKGDILGVLGIDIDFDNLIKFVS